MARQSAGLLVYRRRANLVEVFLVHPGGPFWQNKDEGAWSIPKGEFAAGEDPLATAQREFLEETGTEIAGPFAPLQPVKQRGGKTVHAWIVEADFDASRLVSNTFTIEWPPRSGKQQEFPEVDRGEWFDWETATRKINEGQREFIEQLKAAIQ
jgi:predicted NUDIX family NTP pyrophosphohydrolase